MFSTLNRYFSKELAQTFAATSLILLLVIVGESLVSLLSRVVDGKFPADVVMPLLGLGIIKSGILLMPFALLLTIMLVLGRYYRDSEIYAMRASGIGDLSLLRCASLIIVPVVVVLLCLSVFSAPWTAQQIEKIKLRGKEHANLYGLIPGQFIESNQGDWVVFVEKADRDAATVENIFIFDHREGKVAIETAQFAEQKTVAALGGEALILKQGQRYQNIAGEDEFTLLSFDQHAMRISEFDLKMDTQDPEFKATKELLQSDSSADVAQLQWRLSVPIAAILLALLAFPLSVTGPRQGRFAKLGIAIVVYLIYLNLLILMEAWVADGKFPALPGMFLIHAALLTLIIALALRQRARV